MATIAQLKTAGETFRSSHLAKFIAKQDAYALVHGGKFWQGVVPHAVIPDDAVASAPDLTRRPTDQAERWVDLFFGVDALPATWPVTLSVDVYDGPSGKGWSVTVLATKGGILYSRTWNFGPETWREDADWQTRTP